MIGTVEQELRTAGNGTELADYQPLVVDRIMVKHIVPLEKQRVGHEIIVDGIVASPVRGYIFSIMAFSF